MPIFEWKPIFSVGIETIDTQHKKLIGYMNQFFLASGAGKPKAAQAALLQLMRYTFIHFAEEEGMMLRAKYPDLESHKAIHRQLLEVAGKLAKAYEWDPSPANADRMSGYLKAWLANHILGADKKYVPCMQDRALG